MVVYGRLSFDLCYRLGVGLKAKSRVLKVFFAIAPNNVRNVHIKFAYCGQLGHVPKPGLARLTLKI